MPDTFNEVNDTFNEVNITFVSEVNITFQQLSRLDPSFYI